MCERVRDSHPIINVHARHTKKQGCEKTPAALLALYFKYCNPILYPTIF